MVIIEARRLSGRIQLSLLDYQLKLKSNFERVSRKLTATNVVRGIGKPRTIQINASK